MSRIQKNSRVLERCFRDFERARAEYIEKSLEESARALLVAVARNRTFQGFTGNTQTSYACGIYVNGSCRSIISQRNWSEPPLRIKIKKGQSVYLQEPYEGDARWVKGAVDVTNEYGLETSIRFLLDYGDCPKDGYGLVITTGTEYSEIIETVQGLDVLTATADEAYSIIESNFKQMPDWQ